MENKKTYMSPELTVYGDVEKLTEQGGVTSIDVPVGTPADGDVAT